MTRAILFVLDSLGIGGAPDADRFGDAGADTLGHIAEAMALEVPHLRSLGLGLAAAASTGRDPLGACAIVGRWGLAREISKGKDTITGHWELAGVPVPFDWHYYPNTVPAFPKELTNALVDRCRLPGLLGLKHASGTAIIEELGEEHLRTGKPIIYTSADSVIQFAAHEESFGLTRLYELCAEARRMTYNLRVGRIVARPFLGEGRGSFWRTANRKDFSLAPPSPTLLDVASKAGREVVSVGKIGDIFAHSGTGREIKASGHGPLMDASLAAIAGLADGGLVMTNFVDFDTNFGHRRDVVGYGRALEEFDAMLPRVFSALQPGDLLVLTADHGNDPSWKGTDHTREQVPILCFGLGVAPGFLGHRSCFADTGQTVAAHLGVGPLGAGTAFPLA
jgi:phosphopentomutase